MYELLGHNDEDGDGDDGDNGGDNGNGNGSSGDNNNHDKEDEYHDREQNDYWMSLFNPCIVQVLNEIHTLSMLSDHHHHHHHEGDEQPSWVG